MAPLRSDGPFGGRLRCCRRAATTFCRTPHLALQAIDIQSQFILSDRLRAAAARRLAWRRRTYQFSIAR